MDLVDKTFPEDTDHDEVGINVIPEVKVNIGLLQWHPRVVVFNRNNRKWNGINEVVQIETKRIGHDIGINTVSLEWGGLHVGAAVL